MYKLTWRTFYFFYSKKFFSEFLVEQRVKINEQRVKSNEQRVKSNEQLAKSNEQRAASEKFHLSFFLLKVLNNVVRNDDTVSVIALLSGDNN